jgi:hypothetical protein
MPWPAQTAHTKERTRSKQFIEHVFGGQVWQVEEKERGQGGDGEIVKMGNVFPGSKSIGASELGEGLEAVG